ncbi:rod shape-determining protein MreC [Candidatus Parcubacteria bacterium]|nr:rod shape-determining protein MreC [Candidatus Parcubacteria bacterium]
MMKIIFKIIISVLVIFLFVFLNLESISPRVKNFFYLVSEPAQKWLWQKGNNLSIFFETISEIKSLKKELEDEKLKNKTLMSENLALIELKKENEILRKALEIGFKKDFKSIFAQVIGKDVSQDSILIDQGSKDGIKVGLPVISQQKTLVGKISQVYENFSKVMLISNKESSFDAKITDTETYGIVKGKGNFELYFDLVPKDQKISEGDFLVTSALGGVFPPGLLIGEIKEIKNSDVELFQKAEIKPAFNIKELEFLFVITEW